MSDFRRSDGFTIPTTVTLERSGNGFKIDARSLYCQWRPPSLTDREAQRFEAMIDAGFRDLPFDTLTAESLAAMERVVRDALAKILADRKAADLPAGWVMEIPGYAAFHGVTKAERAAPNVLAYADARGVVVKTWSQDGRGIPVEIIQACIAAAADYPQEFAP